MEVWSMCSLATKLVNASWLIFVAVTPVISPLAFTVIAGTCVEDPNEPTFELTVASVDVPVTSPEPSNDAEVQLTSPVMPIVLPVASVVAVDALPVNAPTKVPALTVEPVYPVALLLITFGGTTESNVESTILLKK